MQAKFTILGCGNSAGTPSIGNVWNICDPDEPRNRRTRPSAVIETAATRLLVDAGPDLREQANRYGFQDLDAVIYTHSHADHILGSEELRVYRHRHKKLVEIYCDQPTLVDLKQRFDYLFIERHELYPQVLKANVIQPEQLNLPMTIGDIGFTPFYQDHGTCQSLGFRFGNLAYSTDMKDLDQQALEILTGIDVWVVDAAGYKAEFNLVHATLRKIYELNEIIQAPTVYLTHMPNFMDYQTMCAELPDGYFPAYDGLALDIVL